MFNLEYKGHTDLKNCDEEPIHLLGKIQSHGLLFGFNRSMQLTHFSENCQPFFDDKNLSPTEINLNDFLGIEVSKECHLFIETKRKQWHTNQTFETLDRKFHLHFSCASDDTFILELEEASNFPKEEFLTKFSVIQRFLSTSHLFTSELDIATSAVVEFKNLSGYDRVMYYKFDYNGDGEVLAEAKNQGLESFLGLRYPASDIPSQARKLYEKVSIRTIADIDDTGIPVYGIQNDIPIDLSYAVFRSVSPIHIKYLQNMGVKATQAHNILVENKLAGMVICHHYSGPKHIDYTTKSLCEYYLNGLNSWILNSTIAEKRKAERIEQKVLDQIRNHLESVNLKGLILDMWEELTGILGLCGFSLVEGEDIFHYQKHLNNRSDLEGIISKSKELAENEEYILTISEKLQLTEDDDNFIGGVAVINTGFMENQFLIFYRPEKKRTYNWAGKPNHHSAEKDNSNELDKLSPRNSFQLWQEVVKGQSAPWTEENLNFLRELANAIELNEFLRINESQNQNADLSESIKVANQKKQIFKLQERNKALQDYIDSISKEVREARKINELRQLVMSNMSHEMRTPLNGIMGLAKLIQNEPDISDTLRHYSKLIDESGVRMLDTFNRLMKLDLSQKSEDISGFESVTLEVMLNNLLSPLKEVYSTKEKTLEWRVHNEKKEKISNQTILSQIILNLVNNSERYCEAGGHIQVDAKVIWKSGEKVLELEIEDDGLGIEPEEQSKIFQPFYTGKDITKTKDEGTGLGLYIVKTYVNYLSGELTLNSKPGIGTKFIITIPLALSI